MPRALVGRDEQLTLAETVRRQLEASYAANCLLFTGLRGVGKTVLLKAIHGGEPARTVRSGDVAKRLKKSATQVSPVRDSLLRAGMIHSPSYGDLEFSVPGFAEYLARRRTS